MYPIYKDNWRIISTIYIYVYIYIYIYIYIYKTRLASNEIFSPSNKIHREVGRAKDLSAPRYLKIKYLPHRKHTAPRLISGFNREVYDSCALLVYQRASSGISLPTFRDYRSCLQGSRMFDSWFLGSWSLQIGRICFAETTVMNCHYSLRNSSEERSCHIASLL